MDTEDIVVGGEHVHGGSILRGVHSDSNLGIVNAGEVASASGLMLLGLKRERVRIDARVWGTSVVLEGLDGVEVLTLLLLEPVLTVENKLEGVEGTNGILSEEGGTAKLTEAELGRTVGGEGDEGVGGGRSGGSVKLDIRIVGLSGEVPHRVLGEGVGEAPHELLDGVVVREAHLLGGARVNGVSASVLNLLNEVLVTLLGKTPTLLSVEVDVVGPDLEGGGVEPLIEMRGQIEVETDLVVLQRYQGQVKTRVAVEEKVEGEVDSLARDTGRHLTVGSLLGVIEVELGVETPPLGILLVNALATNR